MKHCRRWQLLWGSCSKAWPGATQKNFNFFDQVSVFWHVDQLWNLITFWIMVWAYCGSASSSIGSLIQDGHDQHWPGIQCFKIINVDCPSHRWLQQNPRILAWPHPSLSQPCSSTLEPTLNNSCQGSNIGGLTHVPVLEQPFFGHMRFFKVHA